MTGQFGASLVQMERVATVVWASSSSFGRDPIDLHRFRNWLVGCALCIQWSRYCGAWIGSMQVHENCAREQDEKKEREKKDDHDWRRYGGWMP
jgi:hypothetical protein